MAIETELKLQIPARSADVTRLPWISDRIDGPVKRRRLVSVYYDTRKGKLWRHGLTLRVRSDGDRHVQTVKTRSGAGFSRGEWEWQIDSDKPDLRLARRSALGPLIDRKLEKKLRPVFETLVERTTIPVEAHDSRIEIAVDHGQIRTAGHRDTVREIELELKQGDPTALAALAERFAETMPVSVGLLSKAERGYALTADRRECPVRRERIALSGAMCASDALKSIALSCLRHWAGNIELVGRRDTEAVHQMRVGLRRFRAALSIFKALLKDPETEELKDELKWLGNALSDARDCDVFARETVTPLRKAAGGRPELEALEDDLLQRRDRGLDAAADAVQSERCRALAMRCALWIVAGKWSTDTDPLRSERRARPLDAFAREAMTKRAKKIRKRMRKLDRLDGRRRHKLRIAVKKLRYATQFFAETFAHKKQRRRFTQHLKTLQNTLGKLNDIDVHDRISTLLVQDGGGHRTQKLYALGVVAGKEQADMRRCMAAARKAGEKFAGAPRCWH